MPSRPRMWIHAGAALLLAGGLTLAVLSRSSRHEPPLEPEISTPLALQPEEVRTWKAAARQVEQARGEPVGRAAAVRVPAQLRHYAERRRFLAVQVAETEEQQLDLPHDEAELVEMIREGVLVEMKTLGEDYILYGVGASASSEAFSHYDARRGVRITLFESWADYKDADQEIQKEIDEKRAEIEVKRAELRRTSARRRTRRRQLQSQIQGLQGQAAGIEARRKLLESYYEDYDRRRLLVREYHTIHDLARDFDGRTYELGKPLQRRLLRARLLSFIRPAAREVILQLARDYHREFDRPLPVTSLIRTEEYQRWLGRTNPNATTIDSPPHATGLAFDVHYGHMTAREQQHVMDALARMESEGALEALRENRNHFHVFVFPDQERPSERLIADALDEVRPGAVAARAAPRKKATATSSRARRSSSAGKAPAPRRSTAVRKAPSRRDSSVRQGSGSRRAPARKTTRKPTPRPRRR